MIQLTVFGIDPWAKERAAYRTTQAYAMQRVRMLDRADYHCAVCGRGPKGRLRLELHHNNYDRSPGKELDSDWVVLCTDCHRQATAFQREQRRRIRRE